MGLVTIEHDGAGTRQLSSPQTQVAFARMTLERVEGTGRDQLADTIWPEGLPDTWASALRSVVSRVRAFVTFPDTPDGTPVIAQGGRYLLRLPPACRVDIECAEQEAGEAASAYESGSFTDARRLATSAVSCLRRPFLPEHEGEWAAGLRQHIEETLVSALETASLAAAALRDEHNALKFADDAVRRAPLRESAHRCRMTAHIAAGNRAEALRSYHELRRTLAEELGIDPAPETQAAFVTLLGSPAAAATRPAAPGLSRSGARGAAPFVGRRAELARLAEAWSQAEHGDSQLVLITGESGVGKTRLATEATRRVALSGGLVLFGQCDRGSVVPYQPFVQALSGYLAATPESSLPELGPATRETLLGSPGRVAGELSAAKRGELLLGLTDLFVRVAAQQPVFFVLDDLDVADEDTLMVLRHVFRRRSEISLLLVATAGEAAQRSGRLAADLHDIDRSGWLNRLPLRGMGEMEVQALVNQVVPGPCLVEVPAPAQLIAETAGNAYLLLELVRWHCENDGDGDGFSSAISEYASARLLALDPAPRQLLRIASAAGDRFELDLTAEAAELDEAQAVDALDVLVADGLVAEVVTKVQGYQQVHEYRFVHDVLRLAIYRQFSEARRRWLHTRMADAIELRRAGDLTRYSQTLADHRAAGASPHGDQRAVRWGWRAAARATHAGAPGEAVRLHRQALDHVPSGEHSLRAEALTNLGLAQLAAGHDGSEQTLLDGAIQALHTGQLHVAAQAVLGLGDAVSSRPRLRGEAGALIDMLVRTPDLRSTVDDVTLGRLLARQSTLGGRVSAGPLASAAIGALSGRLREMDGPDLLQSRLTLAEEMLVLAGATEDVGAQLVAAHHRAMAAEMAGDSPGRKDALASLATLAAAVAEDASELLGDALLVDHAVAVAVTQGRFTDAVATTKLAGAVAPGAGHGIAPAPGSLAARQMLVAGWLRRSPWPAAGDNSERFEAAEWSLSALVGGDRGRPHLTLRALATGAEPLPSGDEWAHAVGLLALGAVELGDPTTADALRTLLAPYAELTCGVGYRTFVGPASFHLGRLAVVTGEWDEAERHLTAALTRLADRQARPWLALTQLALARALDGRSRGTDRRGADMLRLEANTTLAQLGLRQRPA